MNSEWPELDGKSPVTTLVFDAVTGKIVVEHPRKAGDYDDTFQLSDSALLDGTVAYSLSDGSRMWDLKDLKLDYTFLPPVANEYAGTAGHSSFILGYDGGRDSLGVISQADPSHPRSIKGTLHEQEQGDVVTARGWIGVYDDRAPQGHLDEEAKARSAHAVSLDALSEAPEADARTFDLGTTLGINVPASLSTGTISVFPATTPDGQPTKLSNLDDSSIWKGSSSVGTVFNPATMTVAPLDQSPHYVTAVGITAMSLESGTPATQKPQDGRYITTTGDGRITIKTGDGNITTVSDVEPGSIYYSPRSSEYNSAMDNIASSWDSSRHISVLSTPGATIAILNNLPEYLRSSRAFRLYGIPG